jgi:hypothetical protein
MRAFLFVTGLGLIAMGEGVILSVWFESERGWPFWMLGIFINILGLSMFGIANQKASILPHLNTIPLAMSLFASSSIVLSIAQVTTSELSIWIFGASLGLGWTLMGVLLMKASPITQK